MHRCSPTAVALAFALAASGVVDAQGPRAVIRPKPDAVDTRFDARYRDFTRLVVKFVEGRAVRLVDGRWSGADGLEEANALLRQATAVTRVFERSVEQLDADRAALLRDLPAGMDPPADLNNYYHVQVDGAARGRDLLRRFLALDVVETAFPEHLPSVPCEPGNLPPETPLFSGQQGFHAPAPAGVDHAAARVIAGGRGFGLQVIDIESSWQLDHEDIPKLVQANVIGQHNMALNPDHGVAVVGELVGEWDRWGITGLVDQTDLKVHSHMRVNWASSVEVAAANTPVGGFIVLEVQLTFLGRTVPMESRQDVFDAVRAATMAGKIVLAAAGNGSEDLDDPVFENMFNRAVRDSGSILVGATSGQALVRASFSNYGSIVDANGWGESVTTAGYGDLFQVVGDPRQDYTATFSGTSSATPIVTGAAMALAGAVREQLGAVLTPKVVRELLQQHGTAVPGGRIGVRPDLAKLLAAVGLPKGLRLRDAGLGGTIQLDLEGAAGASYAVLAALDRGLVPLGAAGRFLLDPTSAQLVFAGIVPASGSQAFSIAVPNRSELRNATLFLQAGLVEQGNLTLTSSVQNYIP